MAANRRRRSSGADDIAEAIHRMVDAMQTPVAAQPRTAIALVRVPTVGDFLRHKLAKFTLCCWMKNGDAANSRMVSMEIFG